MPVATATASLGIGRRTVFTWLRRGRSNAPADALYRELRERVVQARAAHETQLVAALANAPTDDWRLIAHRLETEYPERWGLRPGR